MLWDSHRSSGASFYCNKAEIKSLVACHFSVSPSTNKGGSLRRVHRCDRGQDAVKRSWRFLGVGQTVKRCVSSSTAGDQEAWQSFCACALNQWSRVNGKYPAWSSGQGHFPIVKNLDRGRSCEHGAYGSDPPLN